MYYNKIDKMSYHYHQVCSCIREIDESFVNADSEIFNYKFMSDPSNRDLYLPKEVLQTKVNSDVGKLVRYESLDLHYQKSYFSAGWLCHGLTRRRDDDDLTVPFGGPMNNIIFYLRCDPHLLMILSLTHAYSYILEQKFLRKHKWPRFGELKSAVRDYLEKTSRHTVN